MSTNIWLVGAGEMAREYAKVLNALGREFIVIGRGEGSAAKFKEETGHEVVTGGLTDFLAGSPEIPEFVINAVGIEILSDSAIELMEYGVRNMLLEKPGVGYASELDGLMKKVSETDSSIYLAYNRRFYASVIKAREIIEQDGGVSSFNFEFTEWSHVIKDLTKDPAEHQNWFLGNSTHIVDTAFFLAGKPKELAAFHKGEGNLEWHKTSSNFSGAGVSENGALFSYQANWEAPGRWVIEILTKKHRLIFKPIERLQIQKIGSVAVEEVEGVDYSMDEKFKPGLYLQVKRFLEGNVEDLCTIEELDSTMSVYKKMSGY